MLQLSFFSPLYLTLGFILFSLLGGKFPQWSFFYVSPANLGNTLLMEGLASHSGALVGGLMMAYADTLNLFWLRAIAFLALGYLVFVVALSFGSSPVMVIIAYSLGFYLRLEVFYNADFPFLFAKYVMLRAVVSVSILVLIFGTLFAFSKEFVNYRSAFIYFVIYIPAMAFIDSKLVKHFSKWENEAWNLEKVEARKLSSIEQSDIDGKESNGTVPPDRSNYFLLPNQKLIHKKNIDNLPIANYSSVNTLTLLFSPSHPDRYIVAQKSLPSVTFRELIAPIGSTKGN